MIKMKVKGRLLLPLLLSPFLYPEGFSPICLYTYLLVWSISYYTYLRGGGGQSLGLSFIRKDFPAQKPLMVTARVTSSLLLRCTIESHLKISEAYYNFNGPNTEDYSCSFYSYFYYSVVLC